MSEVSGRVTIRDGSDVESATRGATLDAGELIETGPGSRAVVVRGKDFVTVAPNSRVRIPAAETREAGIFDVLQEWGNAIFQIEKKPDPHFSVGTPYLAAVVKGTTFSITVSEEGASLQVTEGAVETSTIDGGARELIRPGIVAIVAAGDRYRLTVRGQETKVIDSPQRPTAGAGGPDAQSSGGSQQSSSGSGAPGDDSGPQFAFVSETIAQSSSLGPQMIVEPVTAATVDLGQLTGGLVAGTTASQVSSAQAASARDAARGPQFAGQPGNGNGNNGNGNGNGGPNGNTPGNGNGNSGSGNGNGGPNGNTPGNGNGNSGNGNGNGGPNGNTPGNGNGNSGNGNGNGGPNGNTPGNGNGNSGNGNGGA